MLACKNQFTLKTISDLEYYNSGEKKRYRITGNLNEIHLVWTKARKNYVQQNFQPKRLQKHDRYSRRYFTDVSGKNTEGMRQFFQRNLDKVSAKVQWKYSDMIPILPLLLRWTNGLLVLLITKTRSFVSYLSNVPYDILLKLPLTQSLEKILQKK